MATFWRGREYSGREERMRKKEIEKMMKEALTEEIEEVTKEWKEIASEKEVRKKRSKGRG